MTSENPDNSAVEPTDGAVDKVDSAQIALVILVVLAISASAVMLFTDNNSLLKLALIAALWAAIIGFFLVYRYRAQANKTSSEMDLKDQLHEAQLEKAQREGGSGNELERGGASDLTTELLTELKLEIAALRTQLEELSGQPLAYEPDAIRAEARRILEVEGRVPSAKNIKLVEDTEPAGKGSTGAKRDQPSITGTFRALEKTPIEPGSAHEPLKVIDESEPFIAPSTEVASGGAVPGAPSSTAVAGLVGSQDFRRQSSPNPLSALITENSRRAQEDRVAGEPSAQQRPAVQVDPEEDADAEATDEANDEATDEKAASASTKADKPDVADDVDDAATQVHMPKVETPDDAADEAEPAVEHEIDEPAHPAETEAEAAARRGRRRRDENTSGISVAELMKNINKDNK